MLFQVRQDLPHCSLTSSISAVRGVPVNAIFLLPLRPPQMLSKASHHRSNVGMSAIDLSLVTFFGIKKNIVRTRLLPLFSTLFHLLWELHDFTYRFPLLSPREPQGGSHQTLLLFFLHTISTLLPSDSLSALAMLLPHFSIPHSSMAYPPRSAPTHHTASVLPSISLLLRNDPATSHPLPHLPKMSASSLHAVGFEILCNRPAVPSALLIICAHLVLVHFLHLFFIILLFHFCKVSSHPV